MTEAERAAVVEALPSEFPVSEASPPEGDRHWEPMVTAKLTLRRHFREISPCTTPGSACSLRT